MLIINIFVLIIKYLFSGNVPPHNASLILGKAQVIIWGDREGFGKTIIKIQNSKRPFVVGQDMKISEKFYTKARLVWPVEISTALVGVGKTSTIMKVTLKDVKTKEVLIEDLTTLVTVDMKTRRPRMIPPENLNNLDPSLFSYKPPQYPLLEVKGSVFVNHVLTDHTNTDGNKHINRNVYIRYVMNTASRASKEGFFSYFRGDIANYRCKRMTMTFRGEVNAGERLQMLTWEDSENKLKLYFKLMHGKRHINDCIVEFYPNFTSRY